VVLCRPHGIVSAYRNDLRQVHVNRVADYIGSGIGTGRFYGVPGTGRHFGYYGYGYGHPHWDSRPAVPTWAHPHAKTGGKEERIGERKRGREKEREVCECWSAVLPWILLLLTRNSVTNNKMMSPSTATAKYSYYSRALFCLDRSCFYLNSLFVLAVWQ